MINPRTGARFYRNRNKDSTCQGEEQNSRIVPVAKGVKSRLRMAI